MQLFDRTTKDAAFTRLKPLRALIVAIGARRADPEPIEEQEHKGLTASCLDMINKDKGLFRMKVNAAFQSDPAAIGALGAVRKSLGYK